MQPTPQSNDIQSSVTRHVPSASTSGRSSAAKINTSNTSDIMRSNIPQSYPNTSGTSTPSSTQSSFGYESNESSSSSAPRPKRSSLKPSLTNSNRRSSPPIVRFVEPEPLPKSRPTPRPRTLPEPLLNKIPNPLLKPQYRHTPSFTSPTESFMRQLDNHQACAAPTVSGISRLVSLSTPQSGPMPTVKKRSSNAKIALASPSIPDPRWVGIPLPANFTPPTIGLTTRVTSYQSTISIISNTSTQSAPAALETSPATAAPSGQYNPLEHYIPCLYPGCAINYTQAHLGPAYYVPQAPYSLPRLHGYCPRHASKELKEANAACKKEYELLRQHAGRKTMGVVAGEFESFKEGFRDERRIQDAKLQREQRRRVLGAEKGGAKEVWEWKYTLRPCTTASCKTFYTPYSNHLYAFYRTPLPSTNFAPQQTLCPGCAKTEVAGFEYKVKEKWGSRCGWNEQEWNEWFKNAVNDRKMEQEYWVKAQERVVRESGPARWVTRLEDEVECMEKAGEVAREKREGGRGLFRRLFSSVNA
jgi:hypothetical protein